MSAPPVFRSTLLLGLVAAASAGRADAQPGPTVALPDLRGVQSIIIDEWPGKGTAVRAGYRIDRQDETWFFAGSGAFSVTGSRAEPQDRYVMVALPDSVTLRFLTALAAVPVAEGRYAPTDDNPSLAIRLEFRDGTVEFFSSSPGQGMRPWRVTLRGAGSTRELVSDSDAPWRALRALFPYLRRDVLEELKRQRAGAP